MRKLKAESNKQEPTAMYPVPFQHCLHIADLDGMRTLE